ncbi:MAG: hypothetical protein GTN39_03135, partial [Candidatus Aenigmarchaeota archaeon]|nr:hypothetical protein [Candidatus Aenigmarchaeota archaeon]
MAQIKGFEQFGFKRNGENDTQHYGSCPFCRSSKERFYVNKESALWDCKVCGRSGNFSQFLEQISEQHQAAITGALISKLSRSRGIKPQTLKSWGVGWSGIYFTWAARGNMNSSPTDLRRYQLGKKVLATSGSKLSLITSPRDTETKKVWIMEGDWDGMALWECLRSLKIQDQVYASPGAGILPKRLFSLFDGKDVIVCYDNDDAGQRG